MSANIGPSRRLDSRAIRLSASLGGRNPGRAGCLIKAVISRLLNKIKDSLKGPADRGAVYNVVFATDATNATPKIEKLSNSPDDFAEPIGTGRRGLEPLVAAIEAVSVFSPLGPRDKIELIACPLPCGESRNSGARRLRSPAPSFGRIHPHGCNPRLPHTHTPSTSLWGVYRIEPATEGGWIVKAENGTSLFPDQRFDSPAEAWQALQTRVILSGKDCRVMERDEGVPRKVIVTPPGGLARMTIDLPPTAAIAIEQLLNETGDTPGALFGKAIGLYMLSLEAHKRGKAVGSADSPDVLETEFTGF